MGRGYKEVETPVVVQFDGEQEEIKGNLFLDGNLQTPSLSLGRMLTWLRNSQRVLSGAPLKQILNEVRYVMVAGNKR